MKKNTRTALEEMNAELIRCRRCSRLVEWRERVAREKRRAYRDCSYWGRPVPGFGDPQARVFVVGLAPAAHGSNRTGRQFTGDASGDFLFPALYRAGFASAPRSQHTEDGLTLLDLYTAPLCRCAPPANKPNRTELANCRPFLERELSLLAPRVIVALGRMAYEQILLMAGAQTPHPAFAHAAVTRLAGGAWLVSSYHPSRQNTQTGRLTTGMFDQVWQTVHDLLKE